MAKTDMQIGSTGRAVIVNITQIRKGRGLTLQQLSERTEMHGRKLSLSALSLIATGKRRVDVDDLVTLAKALDVSTSRLLSEEPMSFEQMNEQVTRNLFEMASRMMTREQWDALMKESEETH